MEKPFHECIKESLNFIGNHELGAKVNEHLKELEGLRNKYNEKYRVKKDPKVKDLLRRVQYEGESPKKLVPVFSETTGALKNLEYGLRETFLVPEGTEGFPEIEYTHTDMHPKYLMGIGENHLKELLLRLLVKELDGRETDKREGIDSKIKKLEIKESLEKHLEDYRAVKLNLRKRCWKKCAIPSVIPKTPNSYSIRISRQVRTLHTSA